MIPDPLDNPRLMGPAMRKCSYCDIPFSVSRLNKRYCNDLCRNRAHRIGTTKYPRPYII